MSPLYLVLKMSSLYPVSVSAVSQDLIQSSCLPRMTYCANVMLLLREGTSTWAMPGHSLGHQSATLAKLPPCCSSVWVHMHGHSCLVPRVAVQACHNVSRSCPLLFTRVFLCHSVEGWLKRVCMQRAAPQLSQPEMGFGFPNPVSECALGP